MRVLLLAPHPFFVERGTPIAVRLVAQTLIALGIEVDLLTFPIGEEVVMAGLTIYRTFRIPLLGEIPIGFSWKKVLLDVLLVLQMLFLLLRNRYDAIHAVEETVFPAALAKGLARGRLAYDMDSSMPDQLIEKWSWLGPIRRCMEACERFAVRRSTLVLPVCASLADKVRRLHPAANIHPLYDIAFDTAVDADGPPEDLRAGMAPDRLLALYVGNLEHYQGVDLLLRGLAGAGGIPMDLVVIGGKPEDIERHRALARELGLQDRVRFPGPRPLNRLQGYLEQADVLVSPRAKGVNTPMKIYSYLLAGRPVLATRIESHTQVLDDGVAHLVEPSADDLARGLQALAGDAELRTRLGRAARARAVERHSLQAYTEALRRAYASILPLPAA